MKKARPALRYHGGKWRIAPWICSFFPPHRTYVEPYGGAASVLLRKQRSYAEVYNDLDDEVVNVFHVMRDHGPQLKEKLALTPFSRTEYRAAYKPTGNAIERARRTIVKTFMGFGSDSIRRVNGFRGKVSRSGTTPALDWKSYADTVPLTVSRLGGVVIENVDALEILTRYDRPDTLFYVDPPYVRSTRKSKGYKHEMNDQDHRALAAVLHSLKGKVVVSGYTCALYEELYGDWRREEKETIADGSSPRLECLWLNFKNKESLGI